jgi:glycosyltransferase involved in cell wall biosynthesis
VQVLTFVEHDAIRYSIVIPVFNERESIKPLYGAVTTAMSLLGGGYECIFVNDGSSDGSQDVLRTISEEDDRVVVVSLRRNSGKSAALRAGFDVALGHFIITMDGDLQHNATDIPRFVAKLEEGYDVVCGRREERENISWFERLTNKLANWTLARLTGVPIHDFGGGFKAYRRELVALTPLYGELQRLIPVMALRQGGRVCEVPITISPRRHGNSKYGMIQKLPFLFDLITVRFLMGYLSRPLHFFGTAGFFAALSGSLVGLWLLAKKLLFGVTVMQQHGPLMFFAGVLFVSGVQLVALGLLAELQVRHYHEVYDWRTRYTVTRTGDRPHRDEHAIRDRVGR